MIPSSDRKRKNDMERRGLSKVVLKKVEVKKDQSVIEMYKYLGLTAFY